MMFARRMIGAIIAFGLIAVLLGWYFVIAFKHRGNRRGKIVTAIVGSVLVTTTMLIGTVIVKDEYGFVASAIESYEMAQQLEADGNYLYAYWTYSDIQDRYPIKKINAAVERTYYPGNYAIGELYMEEGHYYAAMNAFARVPDYHDAEVRADECMLLYLQQVHPDWFD